ncbi:Rho GTPase activating protein with PAK-box/P21-Rho-binding domain-containing protein [Perilla frutescens var. hirtella]|uniref:Rho GTPase activating protein with PAK-box/P21-Rho-binding domain-containing protein n=1 Tax=Perilla frutescens var. hirtella TaxID=608512 RepID=A0AAD4P129_PERFH|nr:Rho GTPase activating protein with PAK-box/P21-Rho-binding domain-containing protein [Perilla frutescens var. hirtella]
MGDFLSSIGRLQAEQQKQVQEFQLTEKFNSLDTRVSNLESVISNKLISPQVISIYNDLYVPALRPLRQVAKLLLWVSTSSTTIFGVSTESMQLSFDPRDNSIPTILLIMQMHLYSQGGLQTEGIFKINVANSQEEFVRDQLNRVVVPEGTDVHCLAGLIKSAD